MPGSELMTTVVSFKRVQAGCVRGGPAGPPCGGVPAGHHGLPRAAGGRLGRAQVIMPSLVCKVTWCTASAFGQAGDVRLESADGARRDTSQCQWWPPRVPRALVRSPLRDAMLHTQGYGLTETCAASFLQQPYTGWGQFGKCRSV